MACKPGGCPPTCSRHSFFVACPLDFAKKSPSGRVRSSQVLPIYFDAPSSEARRELCVQAPPMASIFLRKNLAEIRLVRAQRVPSPLRPSRRPRQAMQDRRQDNNARNEERLVIFFDVAHSRSPEGTSRWEFPHPENSD